MKIRSLGTKLFHADRQTHMTKLVVAFYSFANALKILGKMFCKIILNENFCITLITFPNTFPVFFVSKFCTRINI